MLVPLQMHTLGLARIKAGIVGFVVLKCLKNKGQSNSTGAFEENPAQPVFSRRREVFAGRLAMFGWAASLIGEISTGRGALGQLQLETGLPPYAIDLLNFDLCYASVQDLAFGVEQVLGIVAYSAIGALNPASPTWSRENQSDVNKRGAGPTQKPQINLVGNPGEFLGVTEFGFSKKNELFVGRVAQLGFVASIIGEKVTGFGPLKQFGLETGIPLGAASFGLLVFIGFLFVAAVFEGNFPFRGDDDKSTY
eukprot:jgi/Botrbrau1/3429/Bobra.139_1s0009.1